MSGHHPLEALKASSAGLRGHLAEELALPTPAFGADSAHLIKFHGLYQQKDRDRPPAGDAPKPPTLLVRGKIPGGRLRGFQWLAWDALADRFGDGTLRLTTRQGLELHGVLKADLPATLRALREALQTTKGACGDVARNILQPPNPCGRVDLHRLDAPVDLLTERFQARSSAYADIFLDGEAVGEPQEEPLYGAAYLPRKFKLALTLAGNNAVDLYTHDLAFAATLGEDGHIEGWFAFAGGGMGMTHRDPETFPRLADLLGWIPAEALVPVAEAVVALQRDFGGRENRRRARLKYLLHDRGLPWFRAEVEARAGLRFQERPLPPWETPAYLGWHRAQDGSWSLGLHTLSGRIQDAPGRPLKSALRDLVRAHGLDLQLTPDQDLVLLGIRPEDRPAVEGVLAFGGSGTSRPPKLYERALACVALPLCGVAITEGERAAPAILAGLQERLEARGLGAKAPVVRITGCPNGCARPYDAEVGIVGQGVGTYALFLGGHPEGHRLAFLAAEKVPLAEISRRLDPLFEAWALEGSAAESFGDFVQRLGEARVRERLALDACVEA